MLIFCDLDGTLIDSSRRHLVLLNDLLAGYGLAPADESYLEAKREGLSTRGWLLRRGAGSPEILDAVCEAWTERIETEPYLRLDAWIEPRCRKIGELRRAGCRIVVVTARKNRDWIRSSVRARFPFLEEEDIQIVSPAAAAAEKRETVRRVSEGRPGILIGDTEADLAACEGTGVVPYLLNTGFRSEAFWNRRGVRSHASLDALGGLLAEVSGRAEREERETP